MRLFGRLGGIILLVAALPLVLAWQPRKPIIYGSAKRPFPAIFQLDYSLCRAEAWLMAIGKAQKRLPTGVNTLLKHFGMEMELARLAEAALFFPVDVVTPEKANVREIRVFLKDDQNGTALEEIATPPALTTLLEMCLIWEMAGASAELRRDWPKSMEAARAGMGRLEALADLLDEAWLAAGLNARWDKQAEWTVHFNGLSHSAAVLLMQVIEANAASLEKADEAVGIFLRREANAAGSEEAALWNRLAVYGLHARGLAHERMGQTALAAADFDAALARLYKAGIHDEQAAAILGSRAESRRQRGDGVGMCADLQAACGIGFCSGLAEARRAGMCINNGQAR